MSTIPSISLEELSLDRPHPTLTKQKSLDSGKNYHLQVGSKSSSSSSYSSSVKFVLAFNMFSEILNTFSRNYNKNSLDQFFFIFVVFQITTKTQTDVYLEVL